YNDNDNGQGLIVGKTYYYQVRAARDTEMNCVSTALTQSIKITVGIVVKPAPIFTGVNEVLDPQACNLLIVGWGPAVSTNPTANIVYDVYRSETATDPGPTAANPGASPNAALEPSFTPTAANKIATVTGLTYTDTNLKLNRVYYYIVQARDTDAGKIDTNNTGNLKAKFNAPSSPSVTNAPVFAFEDFETAAANARFTPPLYQDPVNTADPKGEVEQFQRVTGVQVSTGSETGLVTSMMFGPDANPGDSANNCAANGGKLSDFSTTIGPPQGLTLTPTSVMEFDHFFITEAAFDGGVLEIKVGAPFVPGAPGQPGDATPYPNNVTTFDLGNFIVKGGYNGRLNGTLEGAAIGSPLQGRRAFTGAKTLLEHVRIPLEAFAPGGMHNPNNLPVYIRFRMTSDAASVPACNAGWFVDNLVINNLDPTACPTLGALGIGDLIISEFRFHGALGENDEFIELYNTTNAPIIVSAFDGSAGFTLAAPDANGVLTVLATIPGGAVIPARGHYLIANNGTSGYSLKDYGGTDRAVPDATYTTNIADNSGVALFRTSTTVNLTLDNRLDAAGFSLAPPLYREGTGIGGYPTADGEYSHVRKLTTGLPQDTNDNQNDFSFVGTIGGGIYGGQTSDFAILGAPGPENKASQIQRNAVIKASSIDPGCTGAGSPTSACARVRTGQGAGTNAAFGTLLLRRKFTNTTGQAITRLRFRVVNITTKGNRANNEADLRVLNSIDYTVTDSDGGDVALEGLTLETPPTQAEGGGMNSTLRARLGRQLSPNSSINVEFRLGVMIDGGFRFLVNVEALP
ncbi:MAG TPA: hypothetical protein VM870_08940, partial [Pyrinomonadaceae bacterium]|nr:hypothetical protein [Pyrinomonadaceae bacterium]